MPMIQTDSQHYSDIADAIRDMTDSQTEYYPSEMAAGIRSIPQEIIEEDYFDPVIYSLTEREIGVWTDGKPLYQKTFIWSNTEKDQWVNHDISDLHMDSLCNIFGYANRITSANVVLLHPMQYNELGFSFGTYAVSCRVRNDNLDSRIDVRVSLPSGESTNLQVATIQYTKTTDTAGSGSWTPSGVPAHHYSTTEQVIGTWIDGKTLYEKTIEVNNLVYGKEQTVNHGISNIDKVISYTGYAYNNSGNASFFSYIVPNSITSSNSQVNAEYFFSLTAAGRTTIGYSIGNQIVSQFDVLVITLQYTKLST